MTGEPMWKLYTEGGHVCQLPDPSQFPRDTEIQCIVPRLRRGEEQPCGRVFVRSESGMSWEDIDYGW